jgi:hypothetical protein
MTQKLSEAVELKALIESRIGQDFDGECHLTEAEARRILSALPTGASPAMTPERRAALERVRRIAGDLPIAGVTEALRLYPNAHPQHRTLEFAHDLHALIAEVEAREGGGASTHVEGLDLTEAEVENVRAACEWSAKHETRPVWEALGPGEIDDFDDLSPGTVVRLIDDLTTLKARLAALSAPTPDGGATREAAEREHLLHFGELGSGPIIDALGSLQTLIKYGRWQIGPESSSHHPTLPSAVSLAARLTAALASLSAPTPYTPEQQPAELNSSSRDHAPSACRGDACGATGDE